LEPITRVTCSNVTADHPTEATFEIITHVIAASAGSNGSITPAGAVPLTFPTRRSSDLTPAAHYHVLNVKVDGVDQGPISSYTFSNVTADDTIEATFEITTHAIAASAGANGSITPAGAVSVNDGADQSFTITPAAHYHVL